MVQNMPVNPLPAYQPAQYYAVTKHNNQVTVTWLFSNGTSIHSIMVSPSDSLALANLISFLIQLGYQPTAGSI